MSGIISRVPINSVFAFCNQPGFRSRRNLNKISIMVFQTHLGPLMISHVSCFQVFNFTAHVLRGSSESHPIFHHFIVCLDRVAISHEKLHGAVAYVQDFVRHPLFTPRNFFSETVISMLKTVVAAADVVRHSSEFNRRRAFGVEVGPVLADLKLRREKVVLRRKTLKDTRERLFGAETVASSVVGDAAPRTTVRISDVVEMEGGRYIGEHNKLGLFCFAFVVCGSMNSIRVAVFCT